MSSKFDATYKFSLTYILHEWNKNLYSRARMSRKGRKMIFLSLCPESFLCFSQVKTAAFV